MVAEADLLSSPIRLLDVDPDLGAHLSDHQIGSATERSVVGTFGLSRGSWAPAKPRPAGGTLYVVHGVLARRVRLEGRSSIELMGPGDILRYGVDLGVDTVVVQTDWRVLASAWLAVLDEAFWRGMAAYPQVSLALLDRAIARSRSLSVRLAIVSIRNLAKRVWLLLWHLADVHGHTIGSGVRIDLQLSHELLAQLACARRPAVSHAVKELERCGVLSRVAGLYVLIGGPPHDAPLEPPLIAQGGPEVLEQLVSDARTAGSAVFAPEDPLDHSSRCQST